MCDKLSHSVTLLGIEARETGNTETPGHDFSDELIGQFLCRPRFPGNRKNWHGFCYVLRTTKIKNRSNPIKTRRIGSDITRTRRTETQLTDFFGVDRFARLRPLDRAENNKTTFRRSRTGRIARSRQHQRSKKYVCSWPRMGVAQKAKKVWPPKTTTGCLKTKKSMQLK